MHASLTLAYPFALSRDAQYMMRIMSPCHLAIYMAPLPHTLDIMYHHRTRRREEAEHGRAACGASQPHTGGCGY